MAQIIKAATPPTTPPIRAPRLDAAPEVLDADDGAVVLTWLTPRTEDNAVTRVASEVVEVVGVSELVDDVVSGSVVVVDDDDDEVDESADGMVDEDVVADMRSGFPILAVTAVNPSTDVAPGTEVLEASPSS
jgi:hypothetical protein